MGATAITTQKEAFQPLFAKQDKDLAQIAPPPAQTRSAVGNPPGAFEHGENWMKSSFAKEISPTIFTLMGDPVFRRHAHLRSLLDKNERAIRRRSKDGFDLTCDLLSYCSLTARHYRRSSHYAPAFKPETAMDLSLACAINGVTKEAAYEEAHRA